jgi:hypothetical protein
VQRASDVDVSSRGLTVDLLRGKQTAQPANPQAVAFYEAVGFKPAGEAQTRFGSAPRMSLTVAR